MILFEVNNGLSIQLDNSQRFSRPWIQASSAFGANFAALAESLLARGTGARNRVHLINIHTMFMTAQNA